MEPPCVYVPLGPNSLFTILYCNTSVLCYCASVLTFRHHASYIWHRPTAIPQSTLFIYLFNKYII